MCVASYSLGQIVKLHATPGVNTTFSGWSGPCSGTADCVFPVTGYVSATALFHGTELAMTETAVNENDDFSSDEVIDDSSSSITTEVVQATPSSSIDEITQSSSTLVVASNTVQSQAVEHLVIVAVQIAGVSSANDFVKIYNPENEAVNIGGWKLRKKSSTGSDYSLKEIPTERFIPGGGFFTWANSANGFSTSIEADVSSTETLSINNSVALFDAGGTQIDAISWGTGLNQYGEGPTYPTNPGANQLLTRIFQDGIVMDTENNANDFILQ